MAKRLLIKRRCVCDRKKRRKHLRKHTVSVQPLQRPVRPTHRQVRFVSLGEKPSVRSPTSLEHLESARPIVHFTLTGNQEWQALPARNLRHQVARLPCSDFNVSLLKSLNKMYSSKAPTAHCYLMGYQCNCPQACVLSTAESIVAFNRSLPSPQEYVYLALPFSRVRFQHVHFQGIQFLKNRQKEFWMTALWAKDCQNQDLYLDAYEKVITTASISLRQPAERPVLIESQLPPPDIQPLNQKKSSAEQKPFVAENASTNFSNKPEDYDDFFLESKHEQQWQLNYMDFSNKHIEDQLRSLDEAEDDQWWGYLN